MATVIADRRYTPDDLLRLPDGDRFELVDGQLVEKDMSLLSSFVAGRVTELLSAHARAHESGAVFNSDASYKCFAFDPDLVRRPDVSFIQRSRLRAEHLTGHGPIPPDLAVEVVSPNVQAKVEEYLEAGVQLVWVINPDQKIVEIYRPDNTVSRLAAESEISGEAVLPGFRCSISDLFQPPPIGA